MTETSSPERVVREVFAMSVFSLEGKVAVVTGAGSGIGRSIAVLFARQGAQVEILEIDPEKGRESVEEIREEGFLAECQQCDVSDSKQVERCVEVISKRTRRIDILVNNAGIAHVGNVLNTCEEDLDRIYRVNIKGVRNCLQACVSRMVEGGGGVILNLASIASLVGVKDRFAYSMSKGAVLTMTYSVATDFVQDNIRCNCICPARVHTPFVDGYLREHYPGHEEEMFQELSKWQPIGRMASTEEVAALALYLCSEEAGFLTGCAYPIDGGVLHLT
jgi:NAD(P)-dependent dehydrogenase (short-subunit alcohol dehydrogenase family)